MALYNLTQLPRYEVKNKRRTCVKPDFVGPSLEYCYTGHKKRFYGTIKYMLPLSTTKTCLDSCKMPGSFHSSKILDFFDTFSWKSSTSNLTHVLAVEAELVHAEKEMRGRDEVTSHAFIVFCGKKGYK